MKGILFAVIAGLSITMQGVFNSSMNQVISGWHTTVIVHLVGFAIALIFYLTTRDGDIRRLPSIRPLYITGGAFGVVVIFSELYAFNELGPASAIAILLVAQLLTAFIVELKGWFEEKKIAVKGYQLLGVALMITGVVLFKL
ncbi:DMT family transporter [Salimicrobium salexigens]|uniref:Transporter family-2 protein n=1 Tax=Salimicrobium salexigens TaxID=908941 RepID=A0ABY1KXQ3_9BACI|nr:DMT family transporter [Salimicrobium salexigens]SIS76513.1 transporter family-2 protein [Salimicrobium salexigens]